jgi:hypothetical protein
MYEAGRETGGYQCRNPRRRTQSRRDGAEDPVSVECALLTVGFYLKERQQEDGRDDENQQNGPRPGI